MASTLALKIRTLRKEQGFTLDGLAAAAGMSKSYLWELENRESLRPSAEKLDALAQVLGRPVSYFLTSENDETPEEDFVNEAFFRNFKSLESHEKDMVRTIVDTFRARKGS